MKEQYERQIEEFKQKFITPNRPEQDGMIERVIRTLKEQCTYRHRFGESADYYMIAPDEDHREGISYAITVVVSG